MEAEIEISRRFKLTLNEAELQELMRWYEQLDEKDDVELGGKLYHQLTALRDGTPLNVESLSVPDFSPGKVQIMDEMPTMSVERDPMNFARLRQSSQQGKPVVGGEWLEHD